MEDDQVKHYFIRGLSSSLFTKVRNSDKTLGEILNKLIKIGDDEETPPGVCGIMDMVCSYCNKTNHTISNCFLKKGDMNKGIIRERHPSHPGSPQHNPNHKKVGKVIKKVVFKPKQFKKRVCCIIINSVLKKGIFIKLNIQNKEIHAFLDCGEAVSCISSTLVEEFGAIKDIIKEPHLPKLISANGDSLNCLGKISIKPKIFTMKENKIKPVTFLVVQDLIHPIIIGYDLLMKWSIILKFSTSM
ncbi:hypothetical protein HMI56_004855, partial [Coelomomyces lativittatus]